MNNYSHILDDTRNKLNYIREKLMNKAKTYEKNNKNQKPFFINIPNNKKNNFAEYVPNNNEILFNNKSNIILKKLFNNKIENKNKIEKSPIFDSSSTPQFNRIKYTNKSFKPIIIYAPINIDINLPPKRNNHFTPFYL
jgi:hypothetical protein